MAIINTLITAVDRTGQAVASAKARVKDYSKNAKADLDSVEKSADGVVGAFENIKNFDYSSFDGFRDSLKRIDTQLSSAEGAAGKFFVRLGMLSGGIALATAAAYKMVSSAADYVREMRQVANSTGVTIERLQQMKSVFYDTGLEVEKFGDINKDTLDHLGDAFRDGSGPAEDMKAYGLNLKEFNQYLNQTNGGINAVIHTFYQMRDAGRSQAEIVNMMETLASDSSHLITQLDKLGSEQEALNAINGTAAGVSKELADKYADFDKNVKQLTDSFNIWRVNALAPTVDDLNGLFDLMNKPWDKTRLSQMLQNFMYGGDTAIAKFMRRFDGVSDLDVNTQARDRLNNMAGDALALNNDLSRATPVGGFEKPASGTKKGSKSSAASKLESQQEAARKWLAQVDINNASEQEKAELNYKEQLKQLDKFLKQKAISQEQYEHGVSAINETLTNKNIEANYNRDIKALEDKKARMLLTEEQYNERLLEIQNSYDQQRLDASYNGELNRLEWLHNEKLIREEDYQNRLKGIQDKYAYDNKNLGDSFTDKKTRNAYKEQAAALKVFTDNMSQGIDVASKFSEAIQNQTQEGTAAWYAATIATKAMAVAQAIIMANLTAANVAATTPGPGAIAAGETARAWGYANAGLIAATGIAEIAGKRQYGGQVQAGNTYLVGESGPELLQIGGNSNGQVTSNKNLREALGSQGGGGGDYNATFNIYLQGSGIAQDDIDLLTTTIDAKIDRRIHDSMRYGGELYGK